MKLSFPTLSWMAKGHLIAVASIGLALTACGGNDGGVNSTPPPPSPSPSPTSTPTPTPTPSPTPSASASAAALLPTAVQQAVNGGTATSGYYTAAAGGSSSYGIHNVLTYDQASNTYTLNLVSGTGANGPTTESLSVSTSNASTGPVSGFQYFTVVDPVSGQQDRVIFNDQSSFALSYTSFGLALVGSPGSGAINAVVFGTPTTTLPTTGSATYSGIVGGLANSGSLTYVLSGTSSLTANFGAGSYQTTFSFTGKDIAGSGATLSQQTYNGTAGGSTINGSPLNGQLTGSGTGSWIGSFYGPNAAEYGYTFNVSGSGYNAVGAAVGKKQ